jgi:hypothetical protein
MPSIMAVARRGRARRDAFLVAQAGLPYQKLKQFRSPNPMPDCSTWVMMILLDLGFTACRQKDAFAA